MKKFDSQKQRMARTSRARAQQRGRRIGYARVSTEDQSLALQIDALKRAGCEIILKDRGISGLANERPGLSKALKLLERGSDFVIWKIDRLGRDTEHLNRAAREFRERGISLQSVSEHIDLETPEGRLNFRIKAAYAEYERDVISMRTKAGMDAAKARGQTLGRPRKLSNASVAKARRMLSTGRTTAEAVAGIFGVAPLTLARALKRRASGDGNRRRACH